ncbi:hypothetical protein SpCBS45565_g01479 [Spizellomyces sp. 'palustris']|nr:hypothetical protein SpCBS45565_g01479 [Spizellomyces sp. 'palustris']
MPPFDLLNTPVQETVRLVSTHLSRLATANDGVPGRQHLTRFHARTIPSIDILGYASRILKYAPCGNECFLAMLIYLERMGDPSRRILTGGFRGRSICGEKIAESQRRQPAPSMDVVVIDSYNVHRLMVTGIMLAVKFLSDVFFTNLHMSRVGGLPVHELNQLEVEFLMLNDFNLSVGIEELQYCGDRLLEVVTSPETVDRVLSDRQNSSVPSDRRADTRPSPPRSDQHSQPSVFPTTPDRPKNVDNVHTDRSMSGPHHVPGKGIVPPPAENVYSVALPRGHPLAPNIPYDFAPREPEYSQQRVGSTFPEQHFSSPPPCLEPRYIAEPLSSSLPFDFRDSFSPPPLSACISMKRGTSWHSSSASVCSTGDTLGYRRSTGHYSHIQSSPRHFHPYARSSYKSRHDSSPRLRTCSPRWNAPSPTPSRNNMVTGSVTYQSPPYSPPNAPVPQKPRHLVLPDIRTYIPHDQRFPPAINTYSLSHTHPSQSDHLPLSSPARLDLPAPYERNAAREPLIRVLRSAFEEESEW